MYLIYYCIISCRQVFRADPLFLFRFVGYFLTAIVNLQYIIIYPVEKNGASIGGSFRCMHFSRKVCADLHTSQYLESCTIYFKSFTVYL